MDKTIFSTGNLIVKVKDTHTILGLDAGDGLPAGHYHVQNADGVVVGRYYGSYTTAWPHDTSTPYGFADIMHE